MIELTRNQISEFETFGFIVLRGAIEDPDSLRAESMQTVRDATGVNFHTVQAGGGMPGHFVPATCEHTPHSLELAVTVGSIVNQLLDRETFLVNAHHILYLSEAGWHTDSGWESLRSVHAVAYLDELHAGNGALRVLPCTHVDPPPGLKDLTAVPEGTSIEDFHASILGVPGYVINSTPRDLILFDENLYHASLGGRDRYQWSAVYYPEPTNAREEKLLRAALASCYVAGMELDYDGAAYPNYGRYFQDTAPRHWVSLLKRLGAFDAAAAEEGTAGP